MRTTRGVEALIAIENAAPTVLFARLPGTGELIWPHVRMMFAQAMAGNEMGSVSVASSFSRAKALRDLARGTLPTAYSPGRMPRGDFCFVVGGGTVRRTPAGSENWLVDDFAASVRDRAVVLQSAPISRNHRDRPTFAKTFSYHAQLNRIDVISRFARLSSRESQAVRSAVEQYARELPFDVDPNQVAKIANDAIYRIPRARLVDTALLKNLERVRPRMVFLEDASYGQRSGLIARLKDRGIVVAEPQHGWIGASHGAYNYGSAMATPELVATLPDVLLTFGDYWAKNIRHPARSVPIGKPHLNRMATGLLPLDSRPWDVLVVSSIAEPEETARFTLQLRDALPDGWRVLFRPHPSERPTFGERYPLLVDAERVHLDENSDVYESLRQVRGVVGVASTVLYEALAMGCHVFVRDTAFASFIADAALGERVAGESGIRRIIAELTQPAAQTIAAESIWKSDAAENFIDFLKSMGEEGHG